MDITLSEERSRGWLRASLRLFCLLVPLSIAGANVSWGLALASLIALRAAGGRLEWRACRNALAAALCLYVGAAVLAAACGVDPSNSLRHLNQDVHKLWIFVLFSIALAAEPSPDSWLWLAAGFTAAALIGISQVRFYPGGQGGLEWVRAHAFVHPVTFGEQVAVALLGVTCFIVKRPSGAFASSRARGAAWIFALLTAAALLASQTRGAMLGFAAGAASLCWFAPRMRRVLIPSILAVLAAMWFVSALRYGESAWPRLSDPLPPPGTNVAGPTMRVTLWKIAWLMGKDHPWTGVGPSNYRKVLPTYLDAIFDGNSKSWGTAHNLFLHHFAERGLLGLSATLLFLAVLIGRAFQRARASPDFPNLCSFSTAVAFVVMNLTEVALQTEILWLLIFFVWIWAERLHAARAPEPSPKNG